MGGCRHCWEVWKGKRRKEKNGRNLNPNFWSLSKTNKSEAAIDPASILCRLKGYYIRGPFYGSEPNDRRRFAQWQPSKTYVDGIIQDLTFKVAAMLCLLAFGL